MSGHIGQCESSIQISAKNKNQLLKSTILNENLATLVEDWRHVAVDVG